MGRPVLVFDAVVVAALLVSLYPEFTGYAVHEWLGLALVAGLVAHVVIRVADFLKAGAAGLKARKPGLMAISLLDAAIFIDIVLCSLSGVLISGSVLPAFGLYADGYYLWNSLHSFSAKLLLSLTLVHIVLSWPRICVIFKRRKGSDGRPDGV